MNEYRRLGLLLIMIAAFTCSNCDQKTETQKSTQSLNMKQMEDKKQIEEVLSIYQKSLNTSDVGLAAGLYSANGVFMPTEAPTAKGTENIKKAYEFVFSQIQLNIEFFVEEIVIEGNLAFATTSSKGTVLIHANGQSVPEENRELFIFEKIDGNWKIARYMFNKTSAHNPS